MLFKRNSPWVSPILRIVFCFKTKVVKQGCHIRRVDLFLNCLFAVTMIHGGGEKAAQGAQRHIDRRYS